MDKTQIKEKARYMFIREKANQLQAKSRHTPAMPGAFTVLDRAKRLEQHEPDTEESSATTDSIERAGITAAGSVELAVRQARRARQKNAFHGETHFEKDKPISPQERMRAKAINDYKVQVRNQRAVTSLPDEAVPERKEKTDRPYIKAREAAQVDRNPRHTQPMRGQAPEQKAQAIREQGRKLARSRGIRQTVQRQSRRALTIRKLKAAVQQAARSSARSALLAGGGFVLLLLPVLLLFSAAGALFGNGTEIGNAPVSDEVKAYTGLIQIYALEHGVPEYAELIAAVMMQESGGRGDDPMQASESGFNTEYPKTPGGITDPEYSISVGIQALADCLRMAEAEGPEDVERISLALQGYNFGSGYISWALRSYGGYSELNALEFSDMMAQRMGWPSYGDPQYVQHVLRYYRISDRKK